MKALIEALLRRLDAGKCAVLVRVIGSSGSAPRGPGASMLVDEGGRAFGTVGGGAVEHQATLQAADVLHRGGHMLRDVALRGQDAVCGGDMRLLFQRIDPAEAGFWREALARIGAGEGAYLATNLQSGQMRLSPEPPRDAYCYAQPLAPRGRTFVFGAGHVAQALVPLLTQVDFRAIVLDDRPEFARPERFPGASDVRTVDFARLGGLGMAADDHVVIMTRGHEHDLTVLAQMLNTPAGYIGMMGSKTKRAFVYKSLRGQGFSDEHIARVHSPIGLPISAETPAEIAISIAAELIQFRANRTT